MQTEADAVIDALGGTVAVSRLMDSPASTVSTWRRSGIPKSRMAHLRLLADARGIALPEVPEAPGSADDSPPTSEVA